MTPDQTIDLFRTASAQQWRYNLERIEATTLQAIQKTVDKTRRQIVGEMASTMKDVNLRAHSERVLKELDDLSLGLRKQLGQDLQSATSYVGSRALQEQYDMMSVNGLSPLINNVALSPAQFNAFLTTNPVKGLLIPQWIDKAYGASVKRGLQEGILEELQVGALRGESYARIVSRLESGFDQLTKRELTTLTRTFFQDANTRAYDAIHKANADVIEGRIWTVAGDDRVCILCLPLSEELYRAGESHPEMPRHPNCRCCWRAKTVSYRSLGIDIDELEPIEKAVVTRGYEKDGKWIIPPVGTGGARIRSISFHKGGIKEAFPSMPEAQQKAMIGARRLEMYKAGTLKLEDLVDKRTGKLFLLDELRAGKVSSYVDISPNYIGRTADITDREVRALKSYGGEGFRNINSDLRTRPSRPQMMDMNIDQSINPMKVSEAIKEIDSTFAKNSTTQPIKVFRVLDDKTFQAITSGDRFTDLAYTSTTSDLEGVKFVKKKMKAPLKRVLEIEVPQGTPAIDMNFLKTSQSHLVNEREILLPRGSVFEVVSKTKTKAVVRLVR